jgi:hypothetical protein
MSIPFSGYICAEAENEKHIAGIEELPFTKDRKEQLYLVAIENILISSPSINIIIEFSLDSTPDAPDNFWYPM